MLRDYPPYGYCNILPRHFQELDGKSRITTQFFSIPELVADIVDHLVNNGNPTRHDWKRTLTEVARVSSTFSRPCLAYIWSELGSWYPLLSLLSTSLRRVVDDDGKSVTYELSGPISQCDWERFSYYARFVRVFRVPKWEKLSDAAFYALTKCANGAPILPRLERVDVRVLKSLPDHHYQLFHRGLSTCSFSFPPDTPFANYCLGPYDARAEGVLMKVHQRTPYLEKLHLDIEEPGAITSLEALRLFRNLRTLTLHGQVSCAALVNSCAELPKLSTLVVSLPPSALYDHHLPETVTPKVRGFHQLENLSIIAPPWYAHTALNAIESHCLRSLSIFAKRDLAVWRRFTNIIASRFASLRDLSLCIFGFQAPREDILFADYFGPLTHLRNIVDIRLAAARFEMTVADADMLAMAAAWPRLKTLFLDVAWKPETRTPSVATLQAFAERCPALHTLQLPRLSSLLPSPSSVERSAQKCGCDGGLRDVLFTGERWEDEEADECERFMHDLFPQLPAAEPRYAIAKLPLQAHTLSSDAH